MSHRQAFVRFVASLLLLLPAGLGRALAAGTPLRINSAEQVIQQWKSDQHLYVKGELGIGEPQYAQLEQWLDENAPHWTVVLLRNANGETYRALDGRTYQGMDAVEYALGRGLALRTNFSELVDPRTGETDGAVFVLFLDERRFSYYGSVAQDQRSLGESHWVGELDGPAFRAMKGGGRILDAVKDTITNINQRLASKIALEAEQAERERQSRRRALVNLQTDIEALRQRSDEVAKAAAALKQRYPQATGELTTPPSDDWQRRLHQLAADLTEANVAATTQKFNDLSHDIEGYLNAFAVDHTFDEVVAPLEDELAKLRSDDLSVGRPLADEAASYLTKARDIRARGDRGLSALLDSAQDALARGKQAIADERGRLARAMARRQLILRTSAVTVALLALALLGLLVWLNRRRRPARLRAHQAFAERERLVSEQMEKVYGLFDRSGEILGAKEKVNQRGYEGITKQLTENTFEDVDDLLVMSSEVQRVMDEAREIIYPTSTGGRITNLISSARYEQGMNRISGEPLKFDRDKGLPLVIQRESERTGAEPPEEVTMTFDKVFEAFHARMSRGEETLNTIENSLLQVNDSLKLLQQKIERATAIDHELAEAAHADGLFATPSFFGQLIPSAQRDLDEADDITGVDPVQAMQRQLPSGARKITEAMSIAATIQRARAEIFPKLNECAPALRALGYSTEWIQQEVAQLGGRANELFAEAANQSVAEGVDGFSADITNLAVRAQQTQELAEFLREHSSPLLDKLAENIASARAQLAVALGLAEDHCLTESAADPDAHFAHARELLTAATAALQHGGVDAATQARDMLSEEVAKGQSLIDQSLTVLREFDESSRRRNQQRGDVQAKLPRHEQLLASVRHDYAASSWVLQAGDPSYPVPEATVDTHLSQCRDALREADRLINDAGSKYRAGLLLEAAALLERADGCVRDADTLLSEIDRHCTKLSALSRENEGQLAALERQAQALQSKVQDRRTMRPTIASYQRIVDELEFSRREFRDAVPRDPFQDAATIAGCTARLKGLDAQFAADADAHAEAQRAVEGARHELQTGEGLIQRSRSDGIPDSPATLQSVRAIQSLGASMASVGEQLDGPHNDWQLVDQEATRLHSALSVETARLRGELDRAQQSTALLQAASATVFEATRWSGGFGTRIFGSPGSAELERARHALSQGDYAGMLELARTAQLAAQRAIQHAQREVERQQREAARQAEEQRRRQQQSSMSIGGSSMPSFGAGHHSSGASSGSSGPSGPSSSGSGFSRSGW